MPPKPKYLRKTNRQAWSEEQMSAAIALIESGQCGYMKAAKDCGVPKSTLERRVKGKNKIKKGSLKGLGSRLITFPPELEQELVTYVKNMESMLFGLTATSVRQLAFELAEKNNLPHFFNKDNKAAGWAWLRSFMQRNNLSLRVPEATSAARANAFNKNNVNNFFSLLETVQDQHHFKSSQIFNVDETGITTVQGKQSKIIAMRGRKQVGALTSAERGTLCTAVICMNAAGYFIPPMIVFPRARMKQEFGIGAPPETLIACEPSGWMNISLFEKWFDHFIKYSHASKDNPTLLILDGHKSHTQNLGVIIKARENGVAIICIPPHCTHRMQPLDVCFMGPLSTFYSQEQNTYLRNNPGRVITIYNVAELFGKAYLKAATPLNAMSAFKKTGIFPIDRHVFTEEMFAAALPTDFPLPAASTQIIETPEITASSEVTPQAENNSNLQNSERPQQERFERTPSPQPSTSGVQQTSQSTSSLQLHMSDIQQIPRDTYISPEALRPYPKVTSKKSDAQRKRKTGKAAILTSTPYKEELSESEQKKRIQEAGRIKKNLNQPTKSIEGKYASKKGKAKGKSVKVKLIDNDESSEQESDPECFYCGNSYSSSKKGDGWIKCNQCLRWVHEACAGAEDDEDYFLCDKCQY